MIALQWSGPACIAGSALLLASCGLKSEEERVREIAQSCGLPDLRLKTDQKSGAILIDEPRMSYDPGHEPVGSGTDRQAKVTKAFAGCIQPRAKQKGIQTEYRFTGLSD